MDKLLCLRRPDGRAKLNEGVLLEVLVEKNGSIRLVPKLPVDRALAEKYQRADISWAVK